MSGRYVIQINYEKHGATGRPLVVIATTMVGNDIQASNLREALRVVVEKIVATEEKEHDGVKL